LALIAGAAIGYAIQDQVIAFLMAPLGGQQLVYLTPIGGFNFIFKVSLYFGIGLSIPIIMYQLYRFLEPLMDPKRKRSVVFYALASIVLALAGASFAYFASLPAALHFLTGFNIKNVTAMLTVDSYLAFIITYLLGFAALFQIPLILMIINTIKPLPPKKLMGFQRFVILAAFIVAAIISPTPDITNQTILALPIILMYQVGVLLVWLQARTTRRVRPTPTTPTFTPTSPAFMQPLTRPTQTQTIAMAPATQSSRPRLRPVVMDIAPVRSRYIRSTPRPQSPSRPINPLPRSNDPVYTRSRLRSNGSIDGIVASSQQRLPQATS